MTEQRLRVSGTREGGRLSSPTPHRPPQHRTVGRSLGQGPSGITVHGRAVDPAAPLPACVWGPSGPAPWRLLGGSAWPETEPGCSVPLPGGRMANTGSQGRGVGGSAGRLTDGRTASPQFPGGPATPRGVSVQSAVCAGAQSPALGCPLPPPPAWTGPTRGSASRGRAPGHPLSDPRGAGQWPAVDRVPQPGSGHPWTGGL